MKAARTGEGVVRAGWLKEAVEASLKGDIERAFEKLGGNVAEVKADNIGGAVAARWLGLDAEARENTGVMAPSHELRQAVNGHIRSPGAGRKPALDRDARATHAHCGR